MLVVDASVAVKWVLDEDPAAETAAARSIIGRHAVAAPSLFDFELASILWSKRRRGFLTDAEVAPIALALQAAPIRRINDEGLWLRALSLADSVGHPPYDCAYVAAALVAGAVGVVTADQRFARAFESWRAPHAPDRPFVVSVLQMDRLFHSR
ncbi:type II toxin-antitoxin system VapC family toxin [Azospirillum sp. sgz302134]